MTNGIFAKAPRALKSLYFAENELRRALLKGVMRQNQGRAVISRKLAATSLKLSVARESSRGCQSSQSDRA
jgi:hypothetical protein